MGQSVAMRRFVFALLSRGKIRKSIAARVVRVCVIALAVFFIPALAAFGGNLTFKVDPAKSSLTLTDASGLVGPIVGPLTPPTNLTVSYGGTITADMGASGGTFKITGGNVAAQSDYSFFTVFASDSFVSYSLVQVTVLGFSFSLSSPLIDSPASFDVSQISAAIDSGQANYAGTVTPLQPLRPPQEFDFSNPISGNLLFAAAQGSLIDAGGLETLTIPVDADLVDQNGVEAQFSGEIVATAPVPSPLLGGGFLMALLLGLKSLRARTGRILRAALLFAWTSRRTPSGFRWKGKAGLWEGDIVAGNY